MRRAFLFAGRRCFHRPFLSAKLFEEFRVLRAKSYHRSRRHSVGPVPYPVAVVQIRMTGVAVAHVCLVVAAAGAQRARRKQLWQSYLPSMWPRSRNACCFARSIPVAMLPSACVSESTKRWQRRDVAGRTHAHQAETGAAGVRFVHALIEFGQRVARRSKSRGASPRSAYSEVLLGKHAKLLEDIAHAALADRIQAVGRSSHRRESDLVESQVVLQMTIDATHIRHAGG